MASAILIDKIKKIILENNYFDTLPGEKFKEWNNCDIPAVISFSGRSKKRECYKLEFESDSDCMYVSHLYLNRFGDVMIQLATEDTDDINLILHPSEEPVESYDDETVEEWINLLTF